MINEKVHSLNAEPNVTSGHQASHETEITENSNAILMISSKKPKSALVKRKANDYDPNSYTDQVMQKLDEFYSKKSQPSKARKLKPRKTEAQRDLEKLSLKGTEIIKDLDKYYEQVRGCV